MSIAICWWFSGNFLLETLNNSPQNCRTTQYFEVISSVRTCGVYVWHFKETCIEKNLLDKMIKLKILLQIWQKNSVIRFGSSQLLSIQSLACNKLWDIIFKIFLKVTLLFYELFWNGLEKFCDRLIHFVPESLWQADTFL